MPASQIYVAEEVLTDTQIKTLPSTPVSVVPAPGAGKIIHVVGATVILDVTAGIYTNLDNTILEIGGVTSSGRLAFYVDMLADNSAVFIGDMWPFCLVQGTNALNAYTYTNIDSVANTPLTISSPNGGSGNLTGGNAANSMRVITFYTLIDV